MKKRICLSAFLLVLPLTTGVAQQQPPPLEPGQRVRVTAPDLGISKQVATFEAVRGDTLVVLAESRMFCPLASVTRLDVSRGRKSNVGRGALIGLAVGAVGGAVIGAVGCGTSWWCTTQKGVGMGAAMGGLAGALLGAGIGAPIETDRWEEVPLDQFRVSFGPQRDGRFAFGLSVSF